MQKKSKISQEIWTLSSYYIPKKYFFIQLSYQNLRKKLSRIIYSKWTSLIPFLPKLTFTRSIAFFLK